MFVVCQDDSCLKHMRLEVEVTLILYPTYHFLETLFFISYAHVYLLAQAL